MKVDLTGGRFDAVLFDLDGVLTDTARIHEASWKKMFDAFLKQRAKATGEPFHPFEREDYELDVDGRPRYDGVRDFLNSRGIELPEGSPEDPPDRETVQVSLPSSDEPTKMIQSAIYGACFRFGGRRVRR
jgi:beta-phosphoglucomutase-like phosphatase (HAD superfamily)